MEPSSYHLGLSDIALSRMKLSLVDKRSTKRMGNDKMKPVFLLPTFTDHYLTHRVTLTSTAKTE
jgi:hypothetical protein